MDAPRPAKADVVKHTKTSDKYHPAKPRTSLKQGVTLPTSAPSQPHPCLELARHKRSEACKRLQKLEDEFIGILNEWVGKGHSDIPADLKTFLLDEIQEAKEDAAAALRRLASLVQSSAASQYIAGPLQLPEENGEDGTEAHKRQRILPQPLTDSSKSAMSLSLGRNHRVESHIVSSSPAIPSAE